MEALYQIGDDAGTWIDLRNLPANLVAWQRENPGLVIIELAENLELNIADKSEPRGPTVESS